ncbi:hydrogen gas-evolving membrane-bound hydrogenase subunit E [Haloplasma contractile]|uniref:Membrane bound hydrogenase MbhE subunit protein n=1 Tax=Haloplasma contractile SSD-17B TaxID=1033810 RepID=U2DS65_9MOLU|nr:hydrogen gas-evolving membrane-bound hydrogenase subunit E [Haloplasma contractile]ERJ11392.1 Membrane bound hydrogenase MbhE subunit protein [Haloplasma contractile SSD-17B]
MSRLNEIVNKLYKISLVLLLATCLLFIFYKVHNIDRNRYLSEHYINEGVEETGSINLVTSVLYDYRSFDTLGEATVILIAAAILVFLTPPKKGVMMSNEYTIIVYQYLLYIIPFLVVLGTYLMLFGHLSAGGGFVGGVVIAMIPILLTITFGIEFSEYKIGPAKKSLLENIGAIGFILLGLVGVFIGGNFLAGGQANINLGNPGELISAGLIPSLNLVIGLKVAAGLTTIFNSLIKEE